MRELEVLKIAAAEAMTSAQASSAKAARAAWRAAQSAEKAAGELREAIALKDEAEKVAEEE